ncbi:crystallin, gamma M5 isoform X1 [Pimephales promelas]|uniref:crystallin, gamma M5 isoform X1 n=1 Tax=Pimephales promelas TaxID=90988 RepID=UPI00195596F5|nr:crystallin, gamma M5 isoform X1 [Pimephales promelas]
MLFFQIIFYEDRNFHGRSHEISGDCPDVSLYLSHCSSCRVESGCFMVYECSNFMGHQMLVRRGEYPDNQRIMGMSMSDCIRSCRMIPMHKGTFRMRIFERENFVGQKYELMDDCESIQERFNMPDCQSCNVTHGHWLLYEQPNFEGKMIYIRPGEYNSFNNMGLGTVKVGSIRRIMESC